MASFCVALSAYRVFYCYKKIFSHSTSSYFHTRQLNKDSIPPTLEARVIADDFCGKERTWSSLVSISKSKTNDLSLCPCSNLTIITAYGTHYLDLLLLLRHECG